MASDREIPLAFWQVRRIAKSRSRSDFSRPTVPHARVASREVFVLVF
jgi:hypothetical protein